MMNITEMEEALLAVVHASGLEKLFKPGRMRVQGNRLPMCVSIRLKLNNPYTFLAFEIIAKKSGMKFNIHHTKLMHPELRAGLVRIGGSQDNANANVEFDFDDTLEAKLTSVYKLLLSPGIVELCGAEDYKPLRIIRGLAADD